MAFHLSLASSMLVAVLSVIPVAASQAQSESAACGEGSEGCTASCARFDAGDPRRNACEQVCRRPAVRNGAAACAVTAPVAKHQSRSPAPEARSYSKKSDAIHEREQNGKMAEAIAQGNLRAIRRLIEAKQGLNPTYVYDFDFNPQTRQYEGRAVRLRLTDLFNDTKTLRRDDEGLDKILALFIELGMDVTARLPSTGSKDPASAAGGESARTAWGPSLVFMERAKDREARMRAFALALEKGLEPNDDVGEWLFAELPAVCGRDRSEFAIRVFDLLVAHLGTSLQDDLWRLGERGPETVADVLDRLMSPGRQARSSYERTEFAMMDEVWENCALLSRRLNRYLMEGS